MAKKQKSEEKKEKKKKNLQQSKTSRCAAVKKVIPCSNRTRGQEMTFLSKKSNFCLNPPKPSKIDLTIFE